MRTRAPWARRPRHGPARSQGAEKGASGARWSMVGSFGGQFFFGQGARTGLSPPAVLGGVEMAARDDLGHDLAWGLDLAVGGGQADVHLPGVAPIPERFLELGGGASLCRDFGLTDSLTVSAA